jgi:hypothetical protein
MFAGFVPDLAVMVKTNDGMLARCRLNATLSLGRFTQPMSSSDPMIPVESRVFTSQVSRMSARADYAFMNDYSEGKWPVWVRLVTIIGLSAGLWGAIIWAAVALFG